MPTTKEKVMPQLSEEDEENILVLGGLDRQKCLEAHEVIKEWLSKQPHLPKDMLEDDMKLIRRIIVCKMDVQRTKETIDIYYTLRAAVPEILSNRDPKGEWFERATCCGATVPMPRLTENYERVVVIKCHPLYDAIDQMKILFMISDLRYNYDCCVGDIFVVDCTGVSTSLLTKFTPALLKKLQLLGFKAFGARIAGLHLFNLPQYVDVILSLLKKVITKPKIRDRIHVHSNVEGLHEFIDKKCLPEEYGGDAGPLQEHWDNWKQFLLEHRDWFLEQEELKADESKRPEKSPSTSDLFGFEGFFRQLSVD